MVDNIISQYRRKGCCVNFSIDKAHICEHHFKEEEVKVSHGRGVKTLKTGSLPSIFPLSSKPDTGRKIPTERTFFDKCTRGVNDGADEGLSDIVDVEMEVLLCQETSSHSVSD